MERLASSPVPRLRLRARGMMMRPLSRCSRRSLRTWQEIQRIAEEKLRNVTSPAKRAEWEGVRDMAIQRVKIASRERR